MPVLTESNHANQFGPGMYTSTSFETAVDYAWPGGAIFIFKRPDFNSHSFQVWNPDDGKVMRMVQPWEKDSLLMRETRTASHGCPDRFPDIFQSPIVVDGDIDHQRVQVVFKTPRTFQVLLDLLDTVIYLN